SSRYSTLRYNTAAARDLTGNTLGECVQVHLTEVFPFARAHGQGTRFELPVPQDQKIRNPLDRVLAYLKADLLVPQVRLGAKALFFQGVGDLAGPGVVAIRDREGDGLPRGEPRWQPAGVVLEQDR